MIVLQSNTNHEPKNGAMLAALSAALPLDSTRAPFVSQHSNPVSSSRVPSCCASCNPHRLVAEPDQPASSHLAFIQLHASKKGSTWSLPGTFPVSVLV
eukprot:2101691-Amphidinium_carterae.2